jgi:DNA-binding NarL/FixJ family response regulator
MTITIASNDSLLGSSISLLLDQEYQDALIKTVDLLSLKDQLLEKQIIILDHPTTPQLINEIRSTKSLIAKCIVLVSETSSGIQELIKLGVQSVIHKSIQFEQLTKAIEMVINNHTYFSPNILESVISNIQIVPTMNNKPQSEKLTEFEISVVRLICDEYTNGEIAEILNKSKRTIENRRKTIMEKVHARNIAGLLKFAFTNNIYRLSPPPSKASRN